MPVGYLYRYYPSLAKRLEILNPDLLKQRQLIAQIEVRMILGLHFFQNFKNKIIGTIFIPFLLQHFVTMRANREHELMTVQWSFKIHTASKQHFAIRNIFHLEDTGRFCPFYIIPLDFFF